MNTLYFIVLLFVASAAAQKNYKLIDPFFELREKCLVEANMTHKLLANGPHVREVITPFLLCFGRLGGILTEDGGINTDAFIKASLFTVPENLLVPTTRVCLGRVTRSGVTTPGDKLLVLSICFTEIFGRELFRLTGYCEPPAWRPLDQFYKKNSHGHRHRH